MGTVSAPSAWAIIPARGGSKGIPGKNLKRIQGKTLVARTVAAARGARCVARVFVSTDDAAIAAAAAQAGAEPIARPAALAGDTASSEAALLDALERLQAAGQALPDITVFLQCTSPFTTAEDIDGTVAALLRAEADTAHTVTESHGFLWRIGPDGAATGVNHDKAVRPRRQDRQPEYLETGAVYAMRTAGFLRARHRFFGKTALFPVPASRAIEIDTPQDLEAARIQAPYIAPIAACEVPTPLGGVVFDFDGVMTDNTVIVREDGTEAVVCSRADGQGLAALRQRGVKLAVISRETNAVVAKRCEKLQIACISACRDKRTALETLCADWACTPGDIVFVGNDLPDIPCLEAAGLGVAVADAHPQVLARAGIVLQARGGRGAVRELCERLLATLPPPEPQNG